MLRYTGMHLLNRIPRCQLAFHCIGPMPSWHICLGKKPPVNQRTWKGMCLKVHSCIYILDIEKTGHTSLLLVVLLPCCLVLLHVCALCLCHCIRLCLCIRYALHNEEPGVSAGYDAEMHSCQARLMTPAATISHTLSQGLKESTFTMGFSKNGNPCMVLMASPADLMSANTTHACPRSL